MTDLDKIINEFTLLCRSNKELKLRLIEGLQQFGHDNDQLRAEKKRVFVNLWNCAGELQRIIEAEMEILSDYQIIHLRPIILGKCLVFFNIIKTDFIDQLFDDPSWASLYKESPDRKYHISKLLKSVRIH